MSEDPLENLLQQEHYFEALEFIENQGVLLTFRERSLGLLQPQTGEFVLAPQLQDYFNQLAVVLQLRARALDPWGRSQLFFDIAEGNLHRTQRELGHLADPNQEDRLRQTPLHRACSQSDPRLAESLLAYGAVPNRQDHLGRTPLHLAVNENQTKVAHLLLANGADPQLGDHFGLTPIGYAISSENQEMAELLQNFSEELFDSVRFNQEELQFLRLLRHILTNYGQDLREHSERVAQIAGQLAITMEMPTREQQTLYYGALLHDVGKLSLEENIFALSDEELTSEQKELLQSHPEDGYSAFQDESYKQIRWDFRPIILHHHEKWNGTGYPYQLDGTNIPLGAQIVGLADYLDHLTTSRPYYDAMGLEEALEHLEQLQGKFFSAQLIEVLHLSANYLAPYLSSS